MSKRFKRIAVIAAAALACTVGIALAGMGPGGPGRGAGRGPAGGPGAMFGGGPLLGRLAHDPDIQKSLGLSADQIDRLRTIATEARIALVRQRAEMQAQRIELRSMIASAAATRTAIEQQSERLGRALEQLRTMMTGAMLDARDILTPDQRVLLESELQQRAGDRRQQRRQMRSCPCDAPPDGGPGEGPDGEDDGDE